MKEQKSIESGEATTISDMPELEDQLYTYFAKILQVKYDEKNLKHLENLFQSVDMVDVDPWQALQDQANNIKEAAANGLTNTNRVRENREFFRFTLTVRDHTENGVLGTLQQWEAYKQNTLSAVSKQMMHYFEENAASLIKFIQNGLQAQFLPDLIEIIATAEELIARNIEILNTIPPNLNPTIKDFLQKNLNSEHAEYIKKSWQFFEKHYLEHLLKLNFLVLAHIFSDNTIHVPLQIRSTFKELLPITECLKVALEVPKELKKRHHTKQEYNFMQNFLDLLSNNEQLVNKYAFTEHLVFRSVFNRPEPANNSPKKSFAMDY